jgi:hypothetical protein
VIELTDGGEPASVAHLAALVRRLAFALEVAGCVSAENALHCDGWSWWSENGKVRARED